MTESVLCMIQFMLPSILAILICMCAHKLSVLKSSLPTGLLGNSGGSAWRVQQCPGAPETRRLHAKEEKVAHEGLA